ncbi:MAG: tRNA (N6-threonylcarbamoyladenosine(37)-N6)-methyltransferase TrmO [Desulfatiglandaceae bacterium]
MPDFRLTQIGVVRSPLKDLHQCPRQEREGAPEARIDMDPRYAEALKGLKTGKQIIILTWLHKADRERLKVHPRGNPAIPMRGVFSTRSPHRPNPIGLHQTRLLAFESPVSIRVAPLEAVDGTPVVDIKSVI